MKSARKKIKKTNSFKLKISKKGVAKIVSVVIIAALFAWYFVFTHLFSDNSNELSSYAARPSSESAQQITVEAEDFSTYSLSGGLQTIDDSSASGGKGMMFSLNTSSNGNVMVTSPTSKVTVTARSNRCHGGPTMVVQVGNTEVINKKIPASSWTNYSADLNLPPGSHNVTITFLNDFSSTSGSGCDRVLFVDKLTFQ